MPWACCWTEITRGVGPLEVDFSVDDWWFEVGYAPTGDPPRVAGLARRRHRRRRATSATRHHDQVRRDLMGRSAPGAMPSGDLVVTFRWEP
jgi:hypothetical protein